MDVKKLGFKNIGFEKDMVIKKNIVTFSSFNFY